MSLWDWWTTESRDYVHGMLDQSQCAPEVKYYPLEADKHYVSVLLRRMRIVNVRTGFKKFYGAVHSDIGALAASGKKVNFSQVVAPQELRDVSPAYFDRTIVSNQPLFGPAPYRGGSLQLNAALLSMQSADLLGPYLDVLTDLATLAGVTYIAVAAPFLAPLRRGIDLLTGQMGKQLLEIYLVTNLVTPAAGVYIVMRAPTSEVNLKDLRVSKDFTLSHARGMDLRRYPYMLFSVEGAEDRPDWKGIPEVGAAYEELANELRTDQPQKVNEAMTFFRRTLLLNDDLLPNHARSLVAQVEAKKNEILGAPLTSSRDKATIPTLEAFNPFVNGA